MEQIKPPRLRYGDTVGMIAPCLAMASDYVENAVKKLTSLGFRVKLSPHFFSAPRTGPKNSADSWRTVAGW